MNIRHLSLSLAAVCVSLAVTSPLAAGEPKAVVELFTSQGCSSCPPADKLLGSLAHDPSVIALSLPVDYWDYLGWKDTLALHGHANRQRAYSVARGDRAVYTPQAVINGVVHALGSDKSAIEKAIAESRSNAKPLSVPVSMKVQGDKVIVDVPAGVADAASADVWLCPVTGKIEVTIGRGENSGKALTYYNVVRRWVKLGTWTGKAESFSVALNQVQNANLPLKDIDRLVVILQDGSADKPGLMVGAASLPLKTEPSL
ncbi:MAG: DUF1223 domain-containing protein [Proteobacteria bacterium]|nr:DUF1223 domain-containing protein [Pseudomonadota bacterium]